MEEKSLFTMEVVCFAVNWPVLNQNNECFTCKILSQRNEQVCLPGIKAQGKIYFSPEAWKVNHEIKEICLLFVC